MKRSEFLRTGIGASLLALFPFKVSSKEDIKIIKNSVIEFTPENISEFNVGLYVIEDRANLKEFIGVGVGCVWKLVWQISMNKPTNEINNARIKLPKYGMCNALTDGWTHWIGSKQELCDHLNNNPFGTKYRILTPEELIYIIKNKSNQKQLVRHI